MIKRLCKRNLLVFIILEKKIFQRTHKKNPNTNVQARHDLTFSAVDIIPTLKSQLAIHKYYVNYENTLTCKRISWDSGVGGILF